MWLGFVGAWSEMSPWIFLGLILISVCLPEELSLAEGLAGDTGTQLGLQPLA